MSLKLTVEASEGNSWSVMPAADRRSSGFTHFQEEVPNHPEVVVFALVWCQPMWDAIEDPNEPYRTNKKAYIEAGTGTRHRRMHICTRFAGPPLSSYSGKGYGKFEWVPEPLWRNKEAGAARGDHAGLDMHAHEGDSVFAVHAGKIKRRLDNPAAENNVVGNRVRIAKIPGARSKLSYLHLSAFAPDAADGSWVKAGQIIGEAGRTGNLGLVSPFPTHTHLNTGGRDYDVAFAAKPEIDDANRVTCPTNHTALVFPCHTEVTQARLNPDGCDFSTLPFVNKCWAVGELVCPYMPHEPELIDIRGGGAAARRAAYASLHADLAAAGANKAEAPDSGSAPKALRREPRRIP